MAAVHAGRPGQIRSIQLDHLDLGNRRVVIAGLDRPHDDLTYQLLLEYLEHRRSTWPNTANTHLFVGKESAMRHGTVSHSWILNLRGLPGTIERLRIDRLLEEAIASRGDPLHMAEVFGLSDGTAVRYATNAIKLLESSAERDPAAVGHVV